MKITKRHLRRIIREQLEEEQERTEEQKVKDMFPISPRQAAQLADMVGLEVAVPMKAIVKLADDLFAAIEKLSNSNPPQTPLVGWGAPEEPEWEEWLDGMGLGWLQDGNYNKVVDLVQEIYPLDSEDPPAGEGKIIQAFDNADSGMRNILWGYAGDNFRDRVNSPIEQVQSKGMQYTRFWKRLDDWING